MEGLAMLGQLIGQIQDLLQLHGSPPPPPPPSHFRLLQPHLHPDDHHRRWCLHNVDYTSTDDYYSLVMAAGKSGSCKMLEPFEPPGPPPSKKSRKGRTQEKLHGSTAIPEAEVMEQDIWKEFPEDLLEAIIARLPIASFFRFRSVCRKWNSLLELQSFSQRCAEIPQGNTWFYAFTHDNVNSGTMYYDPSMRKWHHPAYRPTKMIALPVASAGMTLNGNSTTGGYKVMWVGRDGECEVYDSVKNSWSRPGRMPSNIKSGRAGSCSLDC
ncbi:hypothetical protein V6Z12_A03G148000 [Gossypium hirsutum]